MNNTSTITATATTTDALTWMVYAVFDYATFYLCAPLWPLCFLCNLTTIIVFAKTPCATSPTTRFYYLLIAAGELGTGIWKYLIYFLVGNGLIFIGLEQYFPVYRFVDYRLPCALNYIFWYVSDDVSNIPYIALGVERLIALYWPLRCKQILSYKSSIVAMFCMFCVAVLVNLPIIGVVNVVPSAYYVHGVYCAAGKISNFWQAYMAPVYLIYNYIVPPAVSIVVSVVIVWKIRSTTAKKKKMVVRKQSDSASAQLLESCVTLVLMSAIHIVFYVPFGVMRITFVQFGSVLGFSSSQRDLFLAINVNLAVFMLPIQFANFLIYSRRVSGFYRNAVLLWTCRKFESVDKINQGKQPSA